MNGNRQNFQLLWGIALFLMGVGVFFRIPHVMERVVTIDYFAPAAVFIRICFYIMGILLVGGGAKKLYGLWSGDGRAHHSGNE